MGPPDAFVRPPEALVRPPAAFLRPPDTFVKPTEALVRTPEAIFPPLPTSHHAIVCIGCKYWEPLRPKLREFGFLNREGVLSRVACRETICNFLKFAAVDEIRSALSTWHKLLHPELSDLLFS